MTPTAYFCDLDYRFVLSKGKPKTTNRLCGVPNLSGGTVRKNVAGKGKSNGLIDRNTRRPHTTREYERRGLVWPYPPVGGESPSDGDIPYGDLNAHPARFPLDLARDHILSGTNPGDLVIDPMAVSGTTLRAAANLGRRATGIAINPEYCQLIRRRIAPAVLPVEG